MPSRRVGADDSSFSFLGGEFMLLECVVLRVVGVRNSEWRANSRSESLVVLTKLLRRVLVHELSR